MFFEEFENKFFDNLPRKFFGKDVALAVSGGADSVSMLLALYALREKTGMRLHVVTVNHLIRTKEESEGDCEFVLELCKKLNVECCVVNARQGEIFSLADERNKGIEESARFFRYGAFEKFAKEKNCDVVFLAHNKNDQEETLLQRFLQGAYQLSACGIPETRGVFFRPLLIFSREEILKYLEEKGVSFRTDSTNSDVSYFRNRIRNVLVPVLNENFSGWQSAVLHGMQKKMLDEDFFESLVEAHSWKEKNGSFYLEKTEFMNLHLSLRVRLVYSALEKIKAENRISYDNIKKFCNGSTVNTCGISMSFEGEKVLIKHFENSGKNSCLFAIIEELGDFDFDFVKVLVRKSKEDLKNLLSSEKIISVKLPITIEFRENELKGVVSAEGGKDAFICCVSANERF
ncbi:MAG: tRNA lysidine(34) synthetase TilS [Treponemataceae bacterium]|nr:tRNA lysidine(34) synthetase TilS [Treponemataceae bacterium]